MKVLIKLLLVALLANAGYHAGVAAWRFYEFKDAVEQTARFGGAENVAALQQRIVELADEHAIPLEPADVTIVREGTLTAISAAYLEDVALVPRLYTREHLFEFVIRVDPVRPLRGLK